MPRDEAIDDTTRSAEDTSSSATITTPSNLLTNPEPTSSANRVLPIPPGPTSVTRRASRPVSRSRTITFSRSRPIKREARLGSGRHGRRCQNLFRLVPKIKPLAEQHCKIVRDQRAELLAGGETAIGQSVRLDAAEHLAEPGITLRGRGLHINELRHPTACGSVLQEPQVVPSLSAGALRAAPRFS